MSPSRIAAIMVMVVAGLLTVVSVAGAQSGTAGYGQQWVRSRPLTMMGLNVAAGNLSAVQYRGAGFNQLLAWGFGAEAVSQVGVAADNFLEWHVHAPYDVVDTTTMDFISDVAAAGGDQMVGWLVYDEPPSNKLVGAGQVAAYIRQQYPDSLVYTNLIGSSTDQYISDVVSLMNPDVLMYDFYPFRADGSTGVNFYNFLMHFRERGLQAGIPYWAFLQSYEDTGLLRLPSESDARMQLFAHLTAGFSGFAYYTYDQVDGITDTSLLAAGNVPSPLYEPVMRAGNEAKALFNKLKSLTSVDVRFVPGMNGGSSNPTPAGLTDWQAGAGGDTRIADVQVDTTTAGADENGLIGFFTDDNGNQYFMLTNLNHGAGLSAASTELDFTVSFDSTTTQVYRLNRTSGQAELLNLSGNTLNITLPGGTGDLFWYPPATATGLEQIYYDGGWRVDPPVGSGTMYNAVAYNPLRTDAQIMYAARKDGGIQEIYKIGGVWYAGAVINPTVVYTDLATSSRAPYANYVMCVREDGGFQELYIDGPNGWQIGNVIDAGTTYTSIVFNDRATWVSLMLYAACSDGGFRLVYSESGQPWTLTSIEYPAIHFADIAYHTSSPFTEGFVGVLEGGGLQEVYYQGGWQVGGVVDPSTGYVSIAAMIDPSITWVRQMFAVALADGGFAQLYESAGSPWTLSGVIRENTIYADLAYNDQASLENVFGAVVPTAASTCEEVWEYGQGLAADLNQDCYVNTSDYAMYLSDWITCNDPEDPECAVTW